MLSRSASRRLSVEQVCAAPFRLAAPREFAMFALVRYILITYVYFHSVREMLNVSCNSHACDRDLGSFELLPNCYTPVT